MSKIISRMFFMFLLFASVNSFSQDDPWNLVGETEKYKVYLNKDSIKNVGETGSEFNIWLKLECITECNDGYKSISYSVQNWILYCGKNEFIVSKSIDHYTDGEENVFTMDTPTQVMENSPGEKVYNYFCTKQDK